MRSHKFRMHIVHFTLEEIAVEIAFGNAQEMNALWSKNEMNIEKKEEMADVA